MLTFDKLGKLCMDDQRPTEAPRGVETESSRPEARTELLARAVQSAANTSRVPQDIAPALCGE